jgi:hypothetical protein
MVRFLILRLFKQIVLKLRFKETEKTNWHTLTEFIGFAVLAGILEKLKLEGSIPEFYSIAVDIIKILYKCIV